MQVSATLLGEPDMGLLTPPEMARKVGQICTAARSLTVFADADSGEPGGAGGGGGADLGRRHRPPILSFNQRSVTVTPSLS